jgi:hypothetical protein
VKSPAATAEQPQLDAHGRDVGTPDSPYLTSVEAAAYLRYSSVRVLYNAIKTDGIPVRKCGRKKLLFHRGDLDRWLAGEPTLRLLNEARSRKR